MNDWTEIGANWGTFRSRVAQRWLKLSGAELDAIAGNRDALVRVLQSRYGLAKEQADRAVTSFVERLEPPQGQREHPGVR